MQSHEGLHYDTLRKPHGRSGNGCANGRQSINDSTFSNVHLLRNDRLLCGIELLPFALLFLLYVLGTFFSLQDQKNDNRTYFTANILQQTHH